MYQTFNVNLSSLRKLYINGNFGSGGNNNENNNNDNSDDNGSNENQNNSGDETSQLSVERPRAKTGEISYYETPDCAREHGQWECWQKFLESRDLDKQAPRRLEATRHPAPSATDGISYEEHHKQTSRLPFIGNTSGSSTGTIGSKSRLEAVQVASGSGNGDFSAWYRVHSQTYGWLGWANEGSNAGTTGLKNRAEVVDTQVLPNGHIPRD